MAFIGMLEKRAWKNFKGCMNPINHRILSGRHITAYELCVCLRMTTFCHSLSYADVRRQHVGKYLSERSEHVVIRRSSLRTPRNVMHAQKFSAYADVRPVRSEHAMHTQWERSARPRRGSRTLTERPQYADVCGHKMFQF